MLGSNSSIDAGAASRIVLRRSGESRTEAKRELDEVVVLGREIHKCLLKLSLDGLETW